MCLSMFWVCLGGYKCVLIVRGLFLDVFKSVWVDVSVLSGYNHVLGMCGVFESVYGCV